MSPLLAIGIAVGLVILLAPSTAEGNATPPSDERMRWPLDAPKVTSGYGLRVDPLTGAPGSQHTGVDLGAEAGTLVLAALSGMVEFTGVYGGYGNRVVLDHGDGFKTTYNHLAGFAVGPGEPVARGDVIGFVGSTGASTGPHLHFEVVVDGATVDPVPYLP